MHLYFDNVNDAFLQLVKGFDSGSFDSVPKEHHDGSDYTPPITKTPTRNGMALTIDEPVILTYRNPRRRVLFNQGRDANPFFHMVEALWTLAGQQDIKFLIHYNKQVASFSDDGKTWHGAYGWRWQKYFGLDQIRVAIRILTDQPLTRRVVLQMWGTDDLERVKDEPDCKDVPCNTQVMFKVRQEAQSRFLDITITNRSNDLVWGALGSNYVQFSMLQEYMANAIGAEIGLYHQFSNNLHVYTPSDSQRESFRTQSNLMDVAKWTKNHYDWYAAFKDHHGGTVQYLPPKIYATPLDRVVFNDDLDCMFSVTPLTASNTQYKTPFMLHTVQPMLAAWEAHKKREYMLAQIAANQIESLDWRQACLDWLNVHQSNYERAASDGPNPSSA